MEQLRAGGCEVLKPESRVHRKAHARAGNPCSGGERNDGHIAHFNQLFQSVPGVVRDFPEFAEGEGEQIDDDTRQVAIAEDQVGGFEGLLGSLAADPEQLRAIVARERAGIKGVPAIDQGEFRDRCVGGFAFQQGGDDEGKPGGGVGGDDFRDAAAGKTGGIPEIEVRLGSRGRGARCEFMASPWKLSPELVLEVGEGWIRHGAESLPCFLRCSSERLVVDGRATKLGNKEARNR